MTDLEICERIAAIENLNYDKTKSEAYKSPCILVKAQYGYKTLKYNPLGDALCLQLIFKHKVEFSFSKGVSSQASIPDFSSDDEYAVLSRIEYWSDTCSHNKAALLAIIEAHKK